MSTIRPAKALLTQGKVALAVAVSALLIAAAPAVRVITDLKGDFNGDGKPDRATLESNGKSWKLMARLGGLGAKGVFVLDRGNDAGEGLYLAESKPGRYTPLCEEDDQRRCPKSIRVRYTAINFSGEEGASQVIYWDGAKFQVIQQGD